MSDTTEYISVQTLQIIIVTIFNSIVVCMEYYIFIDRWRDWESGESP